MERYVLTVLEVVSRTVVVYANDPDQAKKAPRAEWQDHGDAGHVVDYSVEDVDGPETRADVCAMTAWKSRCEA